MNEVELRDLYICGAFTGDEIVWTEFVYHLIGSGCVGGCICTTFARGCRSGYKVV